MPAESISVFSIAGSIQAQVAANKAGLLRIAGKLDALAGALTGAEAGTKDLPKVELDHPWAVDATVSTFDRVKLIVDGERGVGLYVWNSRDGDYLKLFADDLKGEASTAFASRSARPLEHAVELLEWKGGARTDATIDSSEAGTAEAQLAANKAQLGRIADELDSLGGVRVGMGDLGSIKFDARWQVDETTYDWASLIVDDERGVGLRMWSSVDCLFLEVYAEDLRGSASDRFAAHSPHPLEHAVELLARRELEHVQS